MKKINYLQPIILFTVLIFTTGCPEEMPPLDGSLKIVNNSNDDIIWFSHFLYSGSYDISAGSFPWGKEIDNNFIIFKDSFNIESFNIDAIKSHYKKGWHNKYYLFSLDSVRTIPWERIKSERIWLKEVTFTTWEEMEACGFTISYP